MVNIFSCVIFAIVEHPDNTFKAKSNNRNLFSTFAIRKVQKYAHCLQVGWILLGLSFSHEWLPSSLSPQYYGVALIV